MKKFSENKINESVEVKKLSLEEEIINLINETISVEINDEPSVNENYTINGKEDLARILTETYNEINNQSFETLKEDIKRKYHNYVDKTAIDNTIKILNEMLNS